MRRVKEVFDKENLKSAFTKDNMKTFFKPTKKKVLILAGVILVVSVFGVFANRGDNKSQIQADDTVMRGDVNVTITGSAAVEPYERYEIISKVNGDITYCPFEVGDEIKKDDILYMFDSSDSDLTVERQKISMQQSENNYQDALKERDKLYLSAKNDGIISDFSIKVGQEIKNGTKVATVTDTESFDVELPFTAAQVALINVGDAATVTSSKHMSSVSGVVTHKSSAAYAGSDGTTLYTVTITFDNPGAFYDGMMVGGSAAGQISPGSGVVSGMASGTISAETEGTVTNIYYKNGDYVKKGTVIATLRSDDVTDKIADSTLSYKSAQLSMQQTEKDLENYSIKSPINGTVITKNAKAGDTIDRTTSSEAMMVVADISKLKFELAIDELDVSKVHEGQSVSITCDAIPNEYFEGIITNVSVEGTAQNGVTTYQAEVEIPNPGNLRPSMNIDAEIIIESAENVLIVPTEDVKTVGGRSYVFVKKEDYDEKINNIENAEIDNELPVLTGEDEPPSEGDMPEFEYGEKPEGIPDFKSGERPEGMPDFKNDEMPEGIPEQKNNNQRLGQANKTRDLTPEAPDGYVAVEVITGVSSEDYTEIKKGLEEGQQIYKMTQSSSQSGFMQGGMGGGMPGGMGGMGGMSGGMPGGMGGGMPGGMR